MWTTPNAIAAGTSTPAGNWTPLVRMQAPDIAVLQDQLNLVAGYADLRADRAREIVAQMAPQYAFWGSVVPLYPARHARTLEVLNLVLRLAKYAEMNFKNAFGVLRPNELSPQIQPMIQTPVHASFPSGHCTECFAVARVLYELVSETLPAGHGPGETAAARAVAAPGGAHCHQPNRRGRALPGRQPGRTTARPRCGRLHPGSFLRAANANANVEAWQFDASSQSQVPAGTDFTGNELYDFAAGTQRLRQRPMPNRSPVM